MPRSSSSSPAFSITGMSLFEPMTIPTRGRRRRGRRTRPRPLSRSRALASLLAHRPPPCPHRARGDVAAHLLAVELDLARPRHRRARAPRAAVAPIAGHVQHPPARGNELAVDARRCRRGGPRPRASRSPEPADLVARSRRIRIAARGQHDRHGPVVGPLELSAREAAGLGARSEQVEQVGAQARQHGLRLGVAEAAVELEHLRPVGGHHQPRVEHAVVRRAAPSQLVDDRLVHRARQHLGVLGARCPARASSCPCRRCSGPRSPSPIRL